MAILVKAIAVVIACMGIINLVNPAVMKKMISFWQRGRRIYIGGLIRIFLGAILLWSSSGARHFCVIALIGALMILGGMTIFIVGEEKMRGILIWWDNKPVFVLRVVACLMVALGALIFFSL